MSDPGSFVTVVPVNTNLNGLDQFQQEVVRRILAIEHRLQDIEDDLGDLQDVVEDTIGQDTLVKPAHGQAQQTTPYTWPKPSTH